jgi:hypothetical protein
VNKPLHVASHSKIDTWSNIPIERNENRFINQPIPIKTEAKSRVDTWLTTDYQTRQRSVEVPYFFAFMFFRIVDLIFK